MFSQLYSIYAKYLLIFGDFDTKKGLISNIYCIKPMLLMWCPRPDSNRYGVAPEGF